MFGLRTCELHLKALFIRVIIADVFVYILIFLIKRILEIILYTHIDEKTEIQKEVKFSKSHKAQCIFRVGNVCWSST
jgi:hypothetical protein